MSLLLIIVQVDRRLVEITEKVAEKDITDIDAHLHHLLPQEKGENTKSIKSEVEEAGHMINIAAIVKDTMKMMIDTLTKGGDKIK